jgi:hypothetical protein
MYLPPYSPDINPIEMAFSKLKAMQRVPAIMNLYLSADMGRMAPQ